MSNLTTRATKGDSLTHGELDTNFKRGAQTKAASYTVVEGDNRDAIDVTAVATITLPDATAIVAAADTGDFQVTLNNTTVAVMTITCVTGTDTIDGSTSDYIVNGIDSITLKVDQAGTGYNIVGGAATKTATESYTHKTLNDSSNTIVSIVRETAIATTSGTSHDFTGIPSWVKKITVMAHDISEDSVVSGSGIGIQLGTSGGIDTTNYYSTISTHINAGTLVGPEVSSSRFLLTSFTPPAITFKANGIYIITNITGNIWVGAGDLINAVAGDNEDWWGSGKCELTGVLTQLRLINNTGNFDGGSINIMYEG